ncbi:MAG: DUF2156 domain-containing protein [Clostridia bacterium]|nr:DUF2156 domain-containing protein [Clostridia bacterium]
MTLEFKAPRIEDRDWVTELMASSERESCEYCFGNIFVWSPIYRTHIARFEDYFLAAGTDEDAAYCFPMGRGDLRRAVDALHDHARANGRQLCLFGVTDRDRQLLEAVYPERFTYETDRDFFDYIYTQQDLASLPGKKYHAKRNHIAAFERSGSYTYERITTENLADCVEMDKVWKAENIDKNPVDLENEQRALDRAFEYYTALRLRGALVRLDGAVVAFTMGEAMGRHMFCTHFEKAFSHVRGAYPMINREFAARELREFPLINREEDTGDEGLRKAKLSYHPLKLLVKYNAVCKD